MTNIERINKRIERERKARKQAEELLTHKSRELYDKNQELESIKNNLEETVHERTIDLENKLDTLKKLKKELEQAKNKAEEASHLKSRFVATISHEIRTPLNGIIGSLDILADEKMTPKASALVEMAVTSGDSLNLILNDILDFSKFEDANFKLDEEYFSITELLSNVQYFWLPQCEEKQINLDIELGNNLDGYFRGDPGRVRQILNNFISNALKYSRSDRILLHAQKMQKSKPTLYFSVKDYGVGISQNDHEFIFEAFAQSDQKEPSSIKGSGLGLAICKQLSKLMLGDVGVHSEVDIGSEFWLKIPAKSIQNAKMNDQDKISDVSDLSKILGFKPTILVVEDVLSNQILIKMMMEKMGIQTIVVSSGSEALDITNRQSFDLIFMDIGLPDIDGTQVTKTIKSSKSNINNLTPVIAFTAHGMQTELDKFEAIGMNGIITKPVKKEDVYQCVISMLKQCD
ncbi:ATP-binding protein [Temperatibacter marinus]|uniref:histidine kinase n=1 Tax=Temperatibacter marinus TaxID=1456591 RepID=A0AA52EEF6_9PROT|nr:ATP-binding protein [Temperatibacter marinus]WND03286.1 ATP-binding protein [Temperatibacter marinus]